MAKIPFGKKLETANFAIFFLVAVLRAAMQAGEAPASGIVWPFTGTFRYCRRIPAAE